MLNATTTQIISPVVADVNDVRDAVLEVIHLWISVKRTSAAPVDVRWAYNVQHVSTNNAGTPEGIINPQSANSFDIGDRQILLWALGPVPPIVLEAADTAQPNGERMIVHHEIKAKRRLRRLDQALCFNHRADVTNELHIDVLARVLLST